MEELELTFKNDDLPRKPSESSGSRLARWPPFDLVCLLFLLVLDFIEYSVDFA
jgi:hypothetical protein